MYINIEIAMTVLAGVVNIKSLLVIYIFYILHIIILDFTFCLLICSPFKITSTVYITSPLILTHFFLLISFHNSQVYAYIISSYFKDKGYFKFVVSK